MPSPLISVVVPALNEEDSIGAVISDTLECFDRLGLDGEMIVVNDGSRDRTRDITESFMRRDSRVTLIHHHDPHGIGASFMEGCSRAKGEFVTMLPGDHENIPEETLKLLHDRDDCEAIVPYVQNPEQRSWFRRSVSRLFTLIVNMAFLTRFKYTNGTNIYRSDLLRNLEIRSNGFFYQTEILVKILMNGARIRHLPYRISERKSGDNKAISLKSLMSVSGDFVSLLAFRYFKSNDSKCTNPLKHSDHL